MKPGEDPRDFDRRRDIWLQCHSEKVLMRMLLPEYDRAAAEWVPSSQAGFAAQRNAPEQTLVSRLAGEQAMLERTCLARGYIDYTTMFMSIVNSVQWEVEKWAGVKPEVTAVMHALREGARDRGLSGLTGRYETAHGLTDPVAILKGLGQGCIASPTRCKLTLALVQKAVSRLCGGFQFRADGRAVPQLSYADDAALICNADTVGGAVATLQLAFETTWMVSQLLGLTISIKAKRKTAWSATYWEDGKEVDVTGWEMKFPDGNTIPQLTGDEEYKYLGAELTSGWKEGRVYDTLRRKAVRKCRQIIGLIGHVPCLRQDQMAKGMSLGIAGILGYYGRSTVIRWEDCVEIEKARIEPVIKELRKETDTYISLDTNMIDEKPGNKIRAYEGVSLGPSSKNVSSAIQYDYFICLCSGLLLLFVWFWFSSDDE